MTPIKFTLHGEAASKANSRKIVTIGKRAAVIKSQKARGYERAALMQIPVAARLRLEGPVRVTMHIWYASERPDLDESIVLDVLQDRYEGSGATRRLVQGGVYRNDRQVREKHVYHGIDRTSPRTVVIVEPMQAQMEIAEPVRMDEELAF
jgi:Holliday junction resolvase RusA-like endonuclease